MKRTMSFIMLFAVAAMAFLSCQKQETAMPETPQEVMLSFTSEKPAFSDQTKTEWTGETIQWSKGDKISVAYTVNGKWQNASGDASGDAKLYKSEALEAADETAQFNVSTYFKGTTEGTHVFYGVYPAPEGTGFSAAPVATLTVAPSQNPASDSFDSLGDLMVGVSDEYSSRPAEGEKISVLWTRLVAHAVITLKDIKGFIEGETIQNIRLTAQEGANLVGSQKVNLLTKEVECNNTQANILTLSAGNLSVANGSVTFWACVLPETITSLIVEIETDKADYVREITGIEKTFKQNARNTLAINMSEAARTEKVVDNTLVTDVLTRATTGVTGTTYSDWSGKTVLSDAVYAGQSAGDKESIQLRSNNDNSGVITTASGGFAKKVSVVWTTGTTNGRTLNVYGKSTAYSAAADLYNANSQGTLLGTIVCGTSTVLEIDGDYEYIGMRSASGAMYLKNIEIAWAPATPKENYLEVSTNAIKVEYDATTASFAVNSDLDWTASSEDAKVTTDGNTVNVSFTANGETEEKTYAVTVSAGGVESQVVTITQEAYVDPSVIEELTVAKFLQKSVSTETLYQLTGTIKNLTNTTYGNFDLVDETGSVYVYGLKENESAGNQTFANLGLKEGDVVTIIGPRSDYDGTAQVGTSSVKAYYVSHVAACAAPIITFADNTVTITAVQGTSVYYTLDGSDPTSSSTLYDASFSLIETKTVKAIAVEYGKPQSAVSEMLCKVSSGEVDSVEYELLFGTDYNSGKISSYTSTWTATNNGFTCTLANWNNNNNSWSYVKAGRKDNASVATITTTDAVSEGLTTVTMTVDAVTTTKINSLKLYVSTNADFSIKDTYTATAAKGDVVFNITNPVANAYYKIEVDCASGSSNGLIQVSKIVYAN